MSQPTAISNPPRSPDAPASTTKRPGEPYPASLRMPGTRQHHLAKAGVLCDLQSLLYIIVIAIFIITFCIQPFRIPSASMENTLLVGDFLLVNKQDTAPKETGWLLPSTRIHRGEIVVFHYPVEPSTHLIKRVIGLPGDHLRLRDGHVYINDQPLSEPYAFYRPSGVDYYRDNFPRLQSADPAVNSKWWIQMHKLVEDGELTIPAGNYFVMGDNRNDSEDSRYWGFVPRDAIVGQPLIIYFSLNQQDDATLPVFRASNSAIPLHRRSGILDSIAGFARWDRTLQVVK
ncbi:MAG TPA: signal peptidase I [Edaphobacter sp.]|nr:signal peptidase I [Edaphobacter sp.]